MLVSETRAGGRSRELKASNLNFLFSLIPVWNEIAFLFMGPVEKGRGVRDLTRRIGGVVILGLDKADRDQTFMSAVDDDWTCRI